jgi:hypothetical protein
MVSLVTNTLVIFLLTNIRRVRPWLFVPLLARRRCRRLRRRRGWRLLQLPQQRVARRQERRVLRVPTWRVRPRRLVPLLPRRWYVPVPLFAPHSSHTSFVLTSFARGFFSVASDNEGGGGGYSRSRSAGACYAFQRGECDRGDSCRYSHDPAAGGSSDGFAARERRPRGACYAFQKGECDRGDACRFSHEAAAEGGETFNSYN